MGRIKGFKHSKETKLQMSKAKLGKPTWNKGLKGFLAGEKHSHWKGEKVSYSGLHHWISKTLGHPNICVNCGFTSDNHHKMHWANKSHKYKRIVSDWIRLCVPCHSKYDSNEDSN